MKKLAIWLSGALTLQLIVAGGLYLGGQSDNTFVREPLLAFDRDKVDKIVIDADGKKMTLLKQDGEWILPESSGLPVNKEKMDVTLAKLFSLRTNWPVATTTGSHERFEVAGDKYQRHISLFENEKLSGELYIGTSPGFRKAHARIGGDDRVYSLLLDGHDFEVKGDSWMDKKLLAVKDIDSIKGNDFSLKKSNAAWSFLEQKEGLALPELDSKKAMKLGDALTSLTVTGVAKEDNELSSMESIRLEVIGASNWQFQFFEKDSSYFVKRNDIDQFFTLSKSDYDQLAGMELSKLKLEKVEPSDIVDEMPVDEAAVDIANPTLKNIEDS